MDVLKTLATHFVKQLHLDPNNIRMTFSNDHQKLVRSSEVQQDDTPEGGGNKLLCKVELITPNA